MVNQPLGHVTGTRSVSGNFTCYLNAEANSSADLFENIIEGTSTITNDFDLLFKVGGTAAPSEVLGAAELEIYGYVGKETTSFKNGATARDIAVAINSKESKRGVVASASTHARLTLSPDNSTDGFTVIAFDLYGMNATAVPITASVKFGTGDNMTLINI